MQNAKLKPALLSAFCFLLSILLTGCATTAGVATARIRESVTIAGTRYISSDSLCATYDLESEWDAVAQRLILRKDGQEIRMMAGASTALVNGAATTMEKELRLYQGKAVIPKSFARRKLIPLFREQPIPRALAPPAVSDLIRTVIIDPGHGGRDPGAVGRRGLKEKDVVLDIARRLKRKLKAAGIRVILTRDSDRFISLTQRSKIANQQTGDSDFFISIHANAARARRTNGVEVYYLSDAVDDDQRSFSAAENYDLNIKEQFSGKNTEAILWSLRYKDDRKRSIALAEQVARALSKKLNQRNRGRKAARFYVLKNTNIPAILIEAGFISNPREEKRLKDPAYRERIAQAIAQSVVQYNRSFPARRTVRR